ncbi:hypothetical protein Hrd1104_08510 [Halorhabdus sp. CBA1104]|uniref:hypothetical protein n=1 Tax=Halorhabdus sp. CBA1104 TaxID=1380432 RepID=UPI0012B1C681|nr:hypothetical protein [Halorhabdus sp. CBA1104]QGN07342.1 hypothetical protein Hrd1104_08510 [Halorhabdus sp. CBA1104]
MAGQQPQRSRQSQTGRFSRSEQIALGSVAAVTIGAFLPWITASAFGTSVSVNGIDGDGVFTLGMAIVAAVLVVARNWDRINTFAIGGLGVLITAFSILYIVDPAFGIEESGAMAEAAKEMLNPGIGLYVTLLGGVGLIAASVLDRLRGSDSAPEQQSQQPPQL